MVDKYSITKDPSATKLSVSKDIDATPVIITKQPGNTRAYLTKNPGGTKVRLVRGGGGSPELYVEASAAGIPGEADSTGSWGLLVNGVLTSQSAETNGTAYALHVNGSPLAVNNGCTYELNQILSDGVEYQLSIDLSHDNSGIGAADWGIYTSSNGPGITTLIDDNIISGQGWRTITYTFTHSASTTRYLGLKERNGNDDGGVYIDNLSLKAT